MTTLAARITKARTDAGLDPSELARRVGVKPAAVYQWESGATKSLKAETAIALADVLGVDIVRLVTGKASKAPPAPQGHSRSVRLDASMLAETHRVLRDLYRDDLHATFFLEDDTAAARFVQLYHARAAMSAHPTQEEWIEYGRKLETIMTPQGADRNGRGDGVPAEGGGTKDVAGRVRRRKA